MFPHSDAQQKMIFLHPECIDPDSKNWICGDARGKVMIFGWPRALQFVLLAFRDHWNRPRPITKSEIMKNTTGKYTFPLSGVQQKNIPTRRECIDADTKIRNHEEYRGKLHFWMAAGTCNH